MIVVDASVAVELLLGGNAAGALAERLLRPDRTLHAPHLIDVEATHAIRRRVMGGSLPERRGREAVRDLRLLPLHRYPHDLLLDRIWELRDNLTPYDAAYAALAEVLDAPLWTCDRGLARSSGHDARTEWVDPSGNPPITSA